MRFSTIATARSIAQRLTHTEFTSVKELVGYMGAIQAQDYGMCRWAIGLRVKGATDKDVTEALDKGTILRTHVLRPTWHIIAAKDIYWMLALSSTKIKALMQTNNRQLELTEKIFTKSNKVIEKELGKGTHLTREALATALEKVKIATDNNRLSHLLERAELDGIACSGKTDGNKRTYALLSERVPEKIVLAKEESLSRLAKIYFTSRGPATVEDFSWWSGLTLTEARQGLELAKAGFNNETIAGKQYWWANDLQLPAKRSASILLLPSFDEYIISYKDRTASLPAEHNKKALTANGIFFPVIVTNGMVNGLWKRSVEKETIQIITNFFEPPAKAAAAPLKKQVKRLQQFTGTKCKLRQ